MLMDNQKHAIISVVLAAKRLWLAGASQEQAAGTELLRAIEALDNAMEYPDVPAPPPAPPEPPLAPEPAPVADPPQPAEPQQPAPPQHVP